MKEILVALEEALKEISNYRDKGGQNNSKDTK